MNASLVSVRVPATTANLGPGFDAVGMAVSLFAQVTVRVGAPEGSRARPQPLRKMITQALQAAYRYAGRTPPAHLRIDAQSEIPLGRGLGASAAARAAGMVAANALLGDPLSTDSLLRLGADLEGHADNIAPALFGGLQVVAIGNSGVARVPVPLPGGVTCAGFTPDFSMPTHETRALLPKRLSREDAVHNSSHAALLIAALATGRWEALREASDERLHQRPRSELFPRMYDFFRAAEEAGAYAAYLSGGGSTVMALTAPARAESVSQALADAAHAFDVPGRAFVAQPCPDGATLLPAGETA